MCSTPPGTVSLVPNTCINARLKVPLGNRGAPEADTRQVERIFLNVISPIKLQRRRAKERQEESLFSSQMVWKNLKEEVLHPHAF